MKSFMRRHLAFLVYIFVLVATLAPPASADDRWILRVHPTLVDGVVKQYDLKVDKTLKENGLYLVSVAKSAQSSVVIDALKADTRVRNVEKNADLRIPELLSASNNTRHKVPVLKNGTPLINMPGNPWIAYLNQPANTIIRIPAAQGRFGQGSSGLKVAVIDTAIDYDHPVLAPVLNTWEARNFVTGSADASVKQETTPFVDQETTPFVDGGGTIILNQETTPFVDQETTPFVDGSKKVPPAFGHGTMVAGIIHLVAPNVRIIPLKAFNSEGWGTIADVIEAIGWAAAHGAQVINMSFSADTNSVELSQAIAEATSAGVICVASVANNGAETTVYPSNIHAVIGVAATTNDDYRAPFSNYGTDVDIAAPGVAVISTYPHNHYAVGWGTSFSTPYVTGTVALMRSVINTETATEATSDLANGGARVLSPELQARRVDVYKATTLAK
jgi:subtilisin family serine protease